MTILQILGAIFLIIILLAVLAYLYLRMKFGKYLNLDKQYEPMVIHLTEDIAPEWINESEAKSKQQNLIDLGFQPAKAYTIDEMPDVSLKAFFKDKVIAVLYEHSIAGVWVDIAIETAGGVDYTYTNAPIFSNVTERPNSQKFHEPEATEKELFEKVQLKIRALNEPLVVAQPQDFRTYFEDAYEKDIAWKNHKGGISFEEFQRVAEDTPFKNKEKNIKEAFIETKEDELYQWHEAAFLKYLKTQELNESDYYDLDLQHLIVPYTTDATAFINYLESQDFVNELQATKLIDKFSDEKNIFKLFDEINELLSPAKRATFIQEMDFPLKLKMYSLPEYEADLPNLK